MATRQYGNMETQRLKDRMSKGGSKPGGSFGKIGKPGEDDIAQEEPMDHENVVAEHGPAHTIHVKHDHEKGQHHVHSVHASGHEQHADFGSVKEAQDHAAKMAGSSEHEGLEDDAANALEAAGHGDGSSDGYESKGAALGI